MKKKKKTKGLKELNHALKSLLKGPSLRSLAASVRAMNFLKPVLAAPLPRAAALVNTSSLFAMNPAAVAGLVIASGGAGVAGIGCGIAAATDGCVNPGPCLLKSSSILC